MSEYDNGPHLIALGVASAVGVVAIVSAFVSNQRKEREQQERARQQRLRDAQERARIFAERRKRAAKRRPSAPAPGRTGFRTDRDPVYNDTTSALIATGILFDHEPYDSGSRNDPSPSSSNDPSPSSSSDSGSSWSGDSGSSSGGGGDY